MFKIIKIIIIFLIIIFIFSLVSYYKNINASSSKNDKNIVFVVFKGEGVKQIGKKLLDAELIKSQFYFKFYVWKTKKQSEFKAGEYVLSPILSIKQVVDILTKGETIDRERVIKIIEGWSIRDIARYFEEEGMFQSEEFMELVGFPMIDYRYNGDLPKPKNFNDKFDFFNDKPDYYGMEGYLFPDTYRIFNDAKLDDIVLKMFDNFDKKLTPQIRADIAKQDRTIYDVITMASVIEKEVVGEKDMKIVSGIFWDRIKNGQPLQSCATLAYILGVNKPQYTSEDTKIDSPYNTYQNQGLPLGPICNPGLNSIKAAVYPEYTDYNYFLSKPGEKETIFSKTYEEHLINKAKYLK